MVFDPEPQFDIAAITLLLAEPPRLPISSQTRRGTHSASLRTSSISFHPASSSRLTCVPNSLRFSKNTLSRGELLSRMPLRVSSGRPPSASHGLISSALAKSRLALSSRRRGRQFGGNLNDARTPLP